MIELYKNKPKRMFMFGCSFTSHTWPTYANIIEHDTGILCYNFGKGGVSNVYISNLIAQCDAIYNFNSDDLVMVQFSGINREDRLIDNEWINIYRVADDDFVKDCVNDEHSLMRDWANIHYIDTLLKYKQTQYHLLSMNKIDTIDLYDTKLIPSFFETLWNNDLAVKMATNKTIHPYYDDCHPTIIESMAFLKQIFNHTWSSTTEDAIIESDMKLMGLIQAYYNGHYSFDEIDNLIYNTISPIINFRIRNFDKRLIT